MVAFELLEQDTSGEAAAAREGGEASPLVVLEPSELRPENPALRSRGILRRRSAPIMGYVGLNGQGKTYCMVRDTLLSIANGRRVLSTVALLDPHTGNPHPLYEPFRSWSQLHEFRGGDVLLDEITGIMDARDSGMPKHIRRLLPQMRRLNVMVRWTGIDWDNTDRRMRQLTQAVVKAKGMLPNHKLARGGAEPDAVSMWAPNRLFRFTTFDAQTLVQSEDARKLNEGETSSVEHRRARAKVLNREFVWGPNSLTFRCYNTLDAVSAVDSSCPICGGRVSEKVCRGHQ